LRLGLHLLSLLLNLRLGLLRLGLRLELLRLNLRLSGRSARGARARELAAGLALLSKASLRIARELALALELGLALELCLPLDLALALDGALARAAHAAAQSTNRRSAGTGRLSLDWLSLELLSRNLLPLELLALELHAYLAGGALDDTRLAVRLLLIGLLRGPNHDHAG